MKEQHSYCSYCGQRYQPDQPWPRYCVACGNTSYLNPLPVAVVLQPVDEGLLLIRRGIDPHKGRLALPGGFIAIDETWQEAGARELHEETGLIIDPRNIQEFQVRSAEDGTLLIFGLAAPTASRDLPEFVPTVEAAERIVVRHPPARMAFRLHQEAVAEYFSRGKLT